MHGRMLQIVTRPFPHSMCMRFEMCARMPAFCSLLQTFRLPESSSNRMRSHQLCGMFHAARQATASCEAEKMGRGESADLHNGTRPQRAAFSADAGNEALRRRAVFVSRCALSLFTLPVGWQ